METPEEKLKHFIKGNLEEVAYTLGMVLQYASELAIIIGPEKAREFLRREYEALSHKN